jgi:hypothetical protein
LEESALYRGRINEIISSLRYCAFNVGDASVRQDLLNMARGSNPFVNEDCSFQSLG